MIRIPEKHLPALRTAESQLQTSNLPVPVLENTNAAQSYVRTHWHILSSDLAAVSALITLARLTGRTPDAPIPFIPPLETLTPETLAELCIRCLEGEKSTLDYNRHSAANNAIILTEDRRNNISKRWIQSPEWRAAMELWDELMASGITFQEEDELKNKIGRIRENPTVEDVQELQRCIGMIAEDAAIGQDGILGKNTTAALQAFIEQCLQEQKEHSNKEDLSHTP